MLWHLLIPSLTSGQPEETESKAGLLVAAPVASPAISATYGADPSRGVGHRPSTVRNQPERWGLSQEMRITPQLPQSPSVLGSFLIP